MMEAGRSDLGIMQRCAQRKLPHRVIFHTLGSCDHPILKPSHPLTVFVSVINNKNIWSFGPIQQLRSIMQPTYANMALISAVNVQSCQAAVSVLKVTWLFQHTLLYEQQEEEKWKSSAELEPTGCAWRLCSTNALHLLAFLEKVLFYCWCDECKHNSSEIWEIRLFFFFIHKGNFKSYWQLQPCIHYIFQLLISTGKKKLKIVY